MLRRLLHTSLLTLALLVPAAGANANVIHVEPAAGDKALTPSQALRKAEAALEGRAADGTHLTLLLKQVAAQRAALSPAERQRANRLLARPTQGDSSATEDEYSVPEHGPPLCSAHYCVHWVDTTVDAPPLDDANANAIPDYVETMSAEFENVFNYENVQLGWRPPKSDGTRGCQTGAAPATCADRTDVYIKEIGSDGIYGYAAPDPGQRGNLQAAYLVMDNDYNAQQFPRYAGNPLAPLQVTAAHEYNHVLQFGYDTAQDTWMFEATATWMEDKAYTAVDDYVQYLTRWSQLSFVPLTYFNSNGDDPTNVKVYGDAVWNRWIDTRHGEDTIRAAWEASLETEPESYAPGAYDVALRAKGSSFYEAFSLFAADTAEWRAANTPFEEGQNYPDMARLADPRTQRVTPLRVDRGVISGPLDHTSFYLVDTELPNPAPQRLRLAAFTQRGAQGAIALVGREGSETGGTSTVFLKRLPRGGPGVVTIDNPGRFSRLTVVLINADVAISGYSAVLRDWVWDNDLQEINARLSTDFTTPTVRGRAPKSRARRVSTRTRVAVRFSDPMIKLSTASVRLIGPGGRKVKTKAALTRGGRKVRLAAAGADKIVLTPTKRLARGRRYKVELSRDLRDLGGNALRTSARTWSFTTKR